MKDIFKPRTEIKPYEYPELMNFVDAMNSSYWVHKEWSFITDVQDFKTELTEGEREVVRRSLLAIAQIEVSVKTFWSKIYDMFPKPEFNSVGTTFAECHVEGTEILTPTGWVDFRDIKKGDKVIQFNEDKTFNITTVKRKIEDYYEGNIHHLHKKSFSTKVTPNHRIAYYDKDNNFKFDTIENLGVKNPTLKIPETGKLQGELDSLSDFDRLKIAIQADGCARYYRNKEGKRIRRGLSKGLHTYELSLKKERKKERLLKLLKSLNLEYRSFKVTRDGYLKIEVDLPPDIDYKQFDWVTLEGKSWKWCKEFVEELSLWDGYSTKEGTIYFGNTNRKCVDIANAVGVAAGFKCNKRVRVDHRKEQYSDVHIVNFVKEKDTFDLSSLYEDIEKYKGNVYCVTVDSGTIVTRLDGKTFIGKNSEERHSRTYSELLEILGLNDDFKELIKVPEIKGRIDYLKKYLKYSTSTDKEKYLLSLTLFSLFVENASLFSQFLIVKSFYYNYNVLKDIDNAITATQKEEDLHANFGAYIVNLVKEEYPEFFTNEFYGKIKRACNKSLEAESKIIDWIFETHQLPFLPKDSVKEFVKFRLNSSLEMIGMDKLFEVDETILQPCRWYIEEMIGQTDVDFFNQKSTEYNQGSKSFTLDSINVTKKSKL